MPTRTVHIGENRGKPRLWIQGAALTEAGFKPGNHYDVTFAPGKVCILINNKDGVRKISGKGAVPIIDITGAVLNEVGPVGTALEITSGKGTLTLTCTCKKGKR